MALEPGTKLGPYEISAPLGAGGMGEVYRARDARLERDVAIKVLPAEVSNDAERLERFQREARAVAALSHPNIMSLYDFETSDGLTYAVMELLEGESLREHLSEGPIAARKAVEMASQIAQGLAAAHEKGIVHRDLKPDNVFVAPDGQVKILDFGLAKPHVVPDEPKGEFATAEATVGPSTAPGMVLGTAAYMSPEQIRGHDVDHRSDLFSFGVLLYEMLAGERPFRGGSAVETMNAVLKEEPKLLSELDTGTHHAVERIVQRCLEKRPEQRFQSARDLAFALVNSESISAPSVGLSGEQAAVPPPAGRHGRPLVPAILLVLGVVAGLLGARIWVKPETTQPVRIQPLTFSGRDWTPSVSPNGDLLAFVSDRDGTRRIWLKQLPGGGEAALTPGRDTAPRFSPDGASVLYSHEVSEGLALYRIGIVGGQARKIIDNAYEGDWSPDGNEVAFLRAAGAGSEIGIVDVRTGSSRTVASSDSLTLYGIRWSPDGRQLVACSAQVTGVVMRSFMFIDIDDGSVETQPTPDAMPVSTPVWMRSTLLFSVGTSRLAGAASTAGRVVRLDPAQGSVTTLFWDRDLVTRAAGATAVEIIGPGRVVFDQFALSQSLAEIERRGDASARPRRPLTRGRSRDRQPAYSPDGSQVLFSSNRSGNLDLWMLETATGAVRQITDDVAEDWDPDFSADGSKILWSSSRSGNLEIWMANADGSNAVQVSNDGVDAENPTATPALEWIVHSSSNPSGSGIWKVRPDGSDATRIAEGVFAIPEVSPDGRYAAYLAFDQTLSVIRVVELETATILPFEIRSPIGGANLIITIGRVRWLPDGSGIAFIGVDDAARTGIYVQDFDPERNTDHTRRVLAGFSDDYGTESFDISGDRIIVSRANETRSLMLATGVPGVDLERSQSASP